MEYRYILVDGHSVIYGSPELRRLHQRSGRRSRAQLLAWLLELQDNIAGQVTLVFDGGKRAKQAETEPAPPGLEVVYSAPGQTADAVIERRVATLAGRGRTLVVTNDRVEQITVEGFGAETMSVAAFLDWLLEQRGQMRQRLERVRWQANRYRNLP